MSPGAPAAATSSSKEDLMRRTLQHCEEGREPVVLPGRLECRLPWLLHAASWLPPAARQQAYSLGARCEVMSRLVKGEEGPPEFTRFLAPAAVHALTDSLSAEKVCPPIWICCWCC